jgi:hypothetical protein
MYFFGRTDRIGKYQNDSLASEEPELEFVCGALGEIGHATTRVKII